MCGQENGKVYRVGHVKGLAQKMEWGKDKSNCISVPTPRLERFKGQLRSRSQWIRSLKLDLSTHSQLK